jgi:hypothetical protein
MEASNTAACGSIKGFATSRQLATQWTAVGRSDVHTPIAQAFDACRETGMRYALDFSDTTYPAPPSSRWRQRPGRAKPR